MKASAFPSATMSVVIGIGGACCDMSSSSSVGLSWYVVYYLPVARGSKVRLTFAALDYLDRTRALVEGTVRPEGIELECLRFGPYELFQRVAQTEDFDVAEMSASTYLHMAA